MSNPNYDSQKLASIKTYITIAYIFSIIGMIAFGLAGIWQIIAWATFAGAFVFYAGYFAMGFLIWGIVLLVFFALAFLIFLRIRRMYTAINQGNITTLKSLNNMMWAILALIFGGVLPGIMLIISFGPINELGQAPTTYPPPPPPPPQ
jgi:hypothetical protein